ncbi:MAG: hypothetical protein EOP36_21175, partial [Rubrivivax sp.]
MEIFKAIPITLKDNVTPPITTIGNTAGAILTLNSQPKGTDKLVMRYRVKDSGDSWRVAVLAKGPADANGINAFGLSTLQIGMLANTYEISYAAMSATGDILNNCVGTLVVTDTSASVTQTAKAVGNPGQVFTDSTGMLHVTEQGVNAFSADWSITPDAGGTTTAIRVLAAPIGGTATPGWFQLQAAQVTTPPGTYKYTLTSLGEDGVTVIQKVSGTFTKNSNGLMNNGPLTLLTPPKDLAVRGVFSSITAAAMGQVTGSPVRTTYAAQSSATNAIYNHVAYSGISGITANLVIPDTSALGQGSVIVERVALNPKNINDLLKELPVSTMGNIFDDDGNVIG